MKKQGAYLVLLASVFAGGCSTVQHDQSKDIQVLMPESNALVELKDVAVEARDELRLLSKAQEAQTYKRLTKDQEIQRFYQSTVVPEGFTDRVTFSYVGNGNLAANANAIAQVAGYKFMVEGRPLINEPQVNIFIEHQPLNEALRELGSQTGSSVMIDIDQVNKVLKYKYLPKVK